MAEALPSKIIKRGNAFSFLEIEDDEKIKDAYKNYSFEGLNIYSSKTSDSFLILSGESFYSTNNSTELDLQTYIEISIKNTDSQNIFFESFEIDLTTMEINIRTKLI